MRWLIVLSSKGSPGTCIPGGHLTFLRTAFTAHVALPVIEQQLECRAGAVTEHGDGPLQWVIAQHLAAHGREAIDACANIDRLGGHKEAALRGELEHQGVAKKARTTASRGSCGSWPAIRR